VSFSVRKTAIWFWCLFIYYIFVCVCVCVCVSHSSSSLSIIHSIYSFTILNAFAKFVLKVTASILQCMLHTCLDLMLKYQLLTMLFGIHLQCRCLDLFVTTRTIEADVLVVYGKIYVHAAFTIQFSLLFLA